MVRMNNKYKNERGYNQLLLRTTSYFNRRYN